MGFLSLLVQDFSRTNEIGTVFLRPLTTYCILRLDTLLFAHGL